MTTSTLTTDSHHTALNFSSIADLIGRVGLAAIFLLSGLSKIQNYDASAQFLVSGGLPEFMLPLVIMLELVGAVCIITGFYTRLAALALAGFCILAAVLYHNNLSDQMQFIMFFKNMAIAGGFLVLAAHGAGALSVDARQTH